MDRNQAVKIQSEILNTAKLAGLISQRLIYINIVKNGLLEVMSMQEEILSLVNKELN